MRKRKNFRKKRPKDDSVGLSVNVYNNNVEGALKVLKRKVKNLQEKINNENIVVHSPIKIGQINHSLQKEEAIKRYTEKLKKESLKYSNQKQSKRKSSWKISC